MHLTQRPAVGLAWLVLATTLTGCASGAMGRARGAERRDDYDRAVIEYNRLMRDDPDNLDVRLLLERAKLRASLQHFYTGRRLMDGGQLDEALVELQLASELNPPSGDITTALQAVRMQLRTRVAVSREGQTQLEALI